MLPVQCMYIFDIYVSCLTCSMSETSAMSMTIWPVKIQFLTHTQHRADQAHLSISLHLK